MTEQTITATEFKAKCLHLLDQVASRKLDRVTVTKRGKVVGVLLPPATVSGGDTRWGHMRGTVFILDGVDLTDPVIDPDDISIYPFDTERQG